MSKFRTAIVTGSTSGIGLAIARSLAESGHAVMLNGFGDPQAIEIERATMAAQTKAPIGFHGADMSDPAQIAELVAATEAQFGAVDIVVNNAGIRDVLLAAQPTREFVQPGQIGALAAFLCTAAANQITGTALPIDGGWTAH